MSVIEIKEISKSYEGLTVLDNLSLSVDKGEIVALLGQNGAGKSTLLESLMGLRQIESGEITLWDKHWPELAQKQREKIAFVAQNCAGFNWMDVKTFLQYLGGFFFDFDETYALDLCQRWSIAPDKSLSKLSGGQYQMVHVIHALATRPEILILDEPVAHLDPSRRRDFIGELVELCCENSTTAIFSSHIISDLERIASKVALLKNGKIVHYHDLEALKASVAKVKFKSRSSLDAIQEIVTLPHYKPVHDGATATITQPLDYSLEAICKSHGIEMELSPMSLEDWYLEVERHV